MKTSYRILVILSLLFGLSVFASQQVITGENEIEKLNSLDHHSEIYLKSAPTGRLKLPGTLGIHDYCTISLISANEIITAGHCLTKQDPKKLVAYFEYYENSQKNDHPYAVTKVKLFSPESDIAILELEGTPGNTYGFYPLAKSIPAVGDALVVYEHPGLDSKSVSRKNCSFLGLSEDRFFHSCDTENYSSGSPILNSNFELVAIHQGALITNDSITNYGHSVMPHQ